MSTEVREFENVWVRMGDMVVAHSLRTLTGCSSGPVALCGVSLVSSISTPCNVTVIEGISRTYGMSCMLRILEVFSVVKTD